MKMFGMSRELFLKLAFIKAFEIEFAVDEFWVKDNLDYSEEEKYDDLQVVAEDDKIYQRIEEYADKIRDLIKALN